MSETRGRSRLFAVGGALAALAPAFGLCAGSTDRGSYAIDAGHVQAVVDIGESVPIVASSLEWAKRASKA